MKSLDKTESGAATLQKYAYLLDVRDIKTWFPPAPDDVILPKAPELNDLATIYRLYLTSNSQKYNFDTVGNHDETGFKQKFTGTHPGKSEPVLKFSKKFLDEGFIIFIPDCATKTTIVLGTPINPLFMESSHEGGSGGKKFTFNFAQQIDDADPYLIGNFQLEQDAAIIPFQDDFIWVLGDQAGAPVIFHNNELIQIYP